MALHTIPTIGPQVLDDKANNKASDTNVNDQNKSGTGKLNVNPADPHAEINPGTFSDTSGSAKQKAKDSYQDTEADETVSDLNTRHSAVIDSIDPEGMFSDYNNNFTWNNPRGNYNAKSYADTLALSREADARNNALIRKPNNIGGYYLGGNSVQPTFNEYTKMPQIDTEEMRAMEASRGIDLGARKAQTDLQAKIQAYNYELQRMSDSQKMQLMYQIGMDEHRFNDAVRKAIFDIDFTQYSESKMRLMFDRMRQQLALYMNQEVANSLVDAIIHGAGTYANVYAAFFAPNPLPEASQLVRQRALDFFYTHSDNYMDLLTKCVTIDKLIATIQAQNVGEGLRTGAEATRGGISNGPRSPYDANDN